MDSVSPSAFCLLPYALKSISSNSRLPSGKGPSPKKSFLAERTHRRRLHKSLGINDLQRNAGPDILQNEPNRNGSIGTGNIRRHVRPAEATLEDAEVGQIRVTVAVEVRVPAGRIGHRDRRAGAAAVE